MKLLVMGAGYVGLNLLKSLQNQPHELFITTTHQDKVPLLKTYGEDVLLLQQDQNDELDAWIDACDGMVVLVAPKSTQSYESAYLHTAKRISAALKERTKPFFLLYTSSTSVCEGVAEEWVTEEMHLSPPSGNGQILLETERLYLNCGADVCILRLGGIYGPYRELIDRARNFSGRELPGTGEEPTNHIHVDDIVGAIIFCIDRRLTGLYQLVNDDHPTRKELYTSLCRSLGLPPPLWNADSLTLRKKGYKVSNKKIRKAGYSFLHPHLLS